MTKKAEAPHTAGPWKAHTDTGSPPFVTRAGASSGWICQTVTWCGMDEARANARLIASAPSLLKALSDLLSAAELDGDEYFESVAEDEIAQAKKAVAEAMGS